MRKSALVFVVAFCLLLVGSMSGPPYAEAGDEFEKAFRDELGRIAAHTAVTVGAGMLNDVFSCAPTQQSRSSYSHRRRSSPYDEAYQRERERIEREQRRRWEREQRARARRDARRDAGW